MRLSQAAEEGEVLCPPLLSSAPREHVSRIAPGSFHEATLQRRENGKRELVHTTHSTTGRTVTASDSPSSAS